MDGNQQKKIDFPAEITFKAIFRNSSYTADSIRNILAEHETADILIEKKASRNGKFISYTITAVFPSNDILNTICSMISALEGFMTLF